MFNYPENGCAESQKMSDIEAMIESLSAEDILRLMANISNRRVNTVDTSFRKRRNAITELYFSAEPKPHQLINDRPMTPEEYNQMREGVTQQCIRGVDIHD